MKKIEELLDVAFELEEISLDDFWEYIDSLPDDGNRRKHKDNINKFFKKNGEPKAKALTLLSPEDHQDFADTVNFISGEVEREIHKKKIKDHALRLKVHSRKIKEAEGKDKKELRKTLIDIRELRKKGRNE